MRIRLASLATLALVPVFVSAACNSSPITCSGGEVQYYTPSSAECPQGNFTCAAPAKPSASPVPQPAPASLPAAPVPKPVAEASGTRSLFLGSRGDDVRAIQQRLITLGRLSSGNDTGYFGPLTKVAVQAFQRANNIVSTGDESTTGYGAIGPRTRAALALAPPSVPSGENTTGAEQFAGLILTRTLTIGSKGEDVSALQRFLTQTGDYTYGEITSYFGPITQAAVQRYQARVGIVSSGTPQSTGFGVVGPRTREFLAQNDQHVQGGSTSAPSSKSCPSGYTGAYPNCSGPATPIKLSCPNYETVSMICAVGYKPGPDTIDTNGCHVPQCVPDSLFPYTAPSPTPSLAFASCVFNNQTIAHGTFIIGHQSSSVAYGSQCVSQTRVCTNGVLSGSYQHANCSVAQMPNVYQFKIIVDINQLRPEEAVQASRFAADGVASIIGNSPEGIDWSQTFAALNANMWAIAENNPGDVAETDSLAAAIGRQPDGSTHYIEDGWATIVGDAEIAGYASHEIPGGYGTIGNRIIVLTRSYGDGDPRQEQVNRALQNPRVAGVKFEFNPDVFSPIRKFEAGCARAHALQKACYLLMPPSLHGSDYVTDIMRAMRYFAQYDTLNHPNTYIVLAAYKRPSKVHFLNQGQNDRNSIEAAVEWLKEFRRIGAVPSVLLPAPQAMLTPIPKADIFLQFPFQGRTYPFAWRMNGLQPVSAFSFFAMSSGWSVRSLDDFNNDNSNDLLLQNGQQLALWLWNGTQLSNAGNITPPLGSGWTVAGTGDFNHDGKADLLLQNDRQLAIWFMDGVQKLVGSGNVSGQLDVGWEPAGVGDFNGDGYADVLLKNGQKLAVRMLNGLQILPESGSVPSELGVGWTVARIGDFDGDTKSDILLQNGQQLAVWRMNGTQIAAGSGNINSPLGAGWSLVRTSDYNGDAKSDVLLRNGQQLAIWFLDGVRLLPESGNIPIQMDMPGLVPILGL